MKNTFTKQERLAGKKTFEALVRNGNEFYQFPFRVKWMYSEKEMPYPAQVAFGVPKRTFKKAVTRNRIKRLLRESYRTNKHFFYDHLKTNNVKVRALFIFTHKEPLEMKEAEAKIILTLQRLIKASDAGKDGTKS